MTYNIIYIIIILHDYNINILLCFPVSSLTCYCMDTCGDDFSCEGIVCYVRLAKVHNGQHNVQDIDYGCFDNVIGGVTNNNSGVCAVGEVHHNLIFKCCSNANFCNQNLTIEAQSSLPSTPPSISLSISPSPTGMSTYILCSVNIHTV